MTASLNALQSAKEKIAVIIALLSILAWNSPVTMKAHAQTIGQENSLVFEVKTEVTDSLNPENQNSQTETEILQKKQELVKEYLESKKSPLAEYTDVLLAQEDWKTILALSNAESSLGKRCYHNNCSGIYGRYDMGYAGLKKYPTKAEWIVDLQKLLDKRYEGWTLEKMNGIYVVPRSNNWIRATSKVYNDLTKIEKQANQI
jgi:hypothetical protein